MSGQEVSTLTQHPDVLTTGSQQPLLPQLLHAINHANEIEITVSFIRLSGLTLILDALHEALERGASLKILTSDYLHITDPKALEQLLSLPGAELRVYQCQPKDGFHMKAYIFICNEQREGCAFIGSNNLSRQALTDAHEWALRYDLIKDNSYSQNQFSRIREAFDYIFHHHQTTELTFEWVQQYIVRRNPPQVTHLFPSEIKEAIYPKPDQELALKALADTREQGYLRGLVVLATGMGKTWLSAFDAQQIKAERVLFVAHREEILRQAQSTFSQLLPDYSTGLYASKVRQKDADCLFASIQTIGKKEHLAQFDPSHFDYVVVDEFHHASAPIYRILLDYFKPQFMLGLTATPERSDQADILSLCDNNLVFERNLVHGIDNGALVPFHYYGIWDGHVDYTSIPWRNGKFDPEALEHQFASQLRAKHALETWNKYKQHRTLAFCVSTKHADYMADYFNRHGVTSAAVHSKSPLRRNQALSLLKDGQLKVLFTVDLFNEGVDLPSIDTVMMLRPSESKIVFLQQLGRGLRLAENKTHLVVMDFIGNHHSFLLKPMAILGASSIRQAVKKVKSPELPKGCFTNFDLEITDFWQKLAEQQRTTALEDLMYLEQKLGHRPTATEFYHEYKSLKKADKNHGSWFELVAAYEKDDKEVQKLIPYFEFLRQGVQKTSMTKCFKAITLRAFIALDGLLTPPSLNDLAEKSWYLLQHYPLLAERDILNKMKGEPANSTAWLAYWKNNPIAAFTKETKTAAAWFRVENNRFVLNCPVRQDDTEVLSSAIVELVDYLLTTYGQRGNKETSS
ncbi:DEAD/DEAH box helicase family protein [Salinivibrio proteolyticus]|uniref:DEAD/DEAH box helicase family protein n=1 Tax=Salinivibrio proteolyticus TaxID=334715 RepID=A0ABY7LH54_9GAMM|nr:DEAD/DEAH box helicase family protein [Salinivibrio proteolyticus]WBA15957.1 DEAD/DEAH box helicase family protein [Salinivibrio proteolyticus]